MNPVSKLALLATCGALALTGCSTQKPTARDTSASTTAAAVTVPQPAANDADAKSSAFLAAAEPFETLTEQAQSVPTANLPGLIADVKKAAASVSPALGAKSKMALAEHIAAVDAAQKANDRTGIALAAVEGYRTLVESASDTGKVPKAVSLLDYSGFHYQADLSAKPVRWDDMAKAVTFAKEQWNGIAARITDTALKTDFNQSLSDMDTAVTAKDMKTAKASSTHELDLVDKLETFFAKQSLLEP